MRQPSTLDLRPSARTSLPSSSSLSVRGPLHTLSRSPPAPTSPTGTHHHPVRTVVLSLFPSVGQVRLSGPSHSPYPCPQPCPRPRCLSNLTLANPLDCHLPSSAFLHRRYPLVLHLSLSLTYHVYLPLLRFSSVDAPPCQFLCETTNGSLPTYLPT